MVRNETREGDTRLRCGTVGGSGLGVFQIFSKDRGDIITLLARGCRYATTASVEG